MLTSLLRRLFTRNVVRSAAEYLLLAASWFGALVAAFAFARILGSDAVGADHAWLLRDRLLLLLGLAGAAGPLAIWWLWHSGRVARAVARVAALFSTDDPSAPAVEVELEVVLPPEEYDLRSAVLLVVDTPRFSTRAVEKINVEDGYYRHSVSREFVLPVQTDEGTRLEGDPEGLLSHLPGDEMAARLLARLGFGDRDGRASRTFLLPILRVRRGVLVDNLEVRTPDGQRVSTLNTNEYCGVIRSLITIYTLALAETEDLSDQQQEGIAEIVRQAHFIAASGDEEPANDDPLPWLEAIAVPTRYGPDSERAAAWRESRSRLDQFCRAVRDAYIVFVPVEGRPSARVVLDYVYTNPHRLSTLGARDRLRYGLGLRPHEHRLSLSEHRWSQSYHLEFWAPYNQYVQKCVVRPLKPRPTGAAAGNIVDYAASGVHGCDYAHVYVREGGRERIRDRAELAVELDCREKPPGMLGNVAAIALAEAVLIWVIGIRHDFYFGSGTNANLVNDLPALLLAAPGVVAGWLGTQISAERLRSTSMATMVGLIVCGLIAIGSTGLALLKTSGGSFASWLHVEHPTWVAFMLVSAVLCVDLTLRLLVKSRRFSAQLRRAPDRRIRHY